MDQKNFNKNSVNGQIYLSMALSLQKD